jgi:ornithine cyclodeaminase/alanine dehydrogenase-like protein (mu-crystallin family)
MDLPNTSGQPRIGENNGYADDGMTLILSNDDVEQLFTIRECIDVLEEAYLELAEGRGISRTTSECFAPHALPDSLYVLKSMDGVVPKFGVSAVRISSDVIAWKQHGNSLRSTKIPAAPNDRFVGLVLLFSTETGEPLAILPDGAIQRMRVGAASALGIKYLAREDASSIGILGSGSQAVGQLIGACAVRDITTIRCFSPNRTNREAFAAKMSSLLGISVEPVAQPEDAIAGADIVMCATNSLDAVLFDRWVKPGMHVSSIKLPEIERAAVARADRVAVHTRDTGSLFFNVKGVVSPKEKKDRADAPGIAIDFKTLPTLPELIAGQVEGRKADRDITCFLNNMGLGYQFAAAGAAVYRKAKAQGLGRDLPTDWFTEDVQP